MTSSNNCFVVLYSFPRLSRLLIHLSQFEEPKLSNHKERNKILQDRCFTLKKITDPDTLTRYHRIAKLYADRPESYATYQKFCKEDCFDKFGIGLTEIRGTFFVFLSLHSSCLI
jgi:hypothetical protein